MNYLMYIIIILSVALSTWTQYRVHRFCLAHFPKVVGEPTANWWNTSGLKQNRAQNAQTKSKK